MMAGVFFQYCCFTIDSVTVIVCMAALTFVFLWCGYCLFNASTLVLPFEKCFHGLFTSSAQFLFESDTAEDATLRCKNIRME
jgi:hypothetical protein